MIWGIYEINNLSQDYLTVCEFDKELLSTFLINIADDMERIGQWN